METMSCSQLSQHQHRNLNKNFIYFRAYHSIEVCEQSTHHLDTNIQLKIIEGLNSSSFNVFN